MCGEQMASSTLVLPWAGSSPRVRGTGVNNTPAAILDGIIPACAGNRKALRKSKTTKRDHPRVCGEQTKDPQLNITHPS